MDNTTTRHYETFKIAFQNNVSLTIANTGDVTVVNPRVFTNGKRRWWCMEELLKEILAGAKDDQERALLIWEFVRQNRHHDDPIFVDDELHDPVKMLNVFGAGLCDDSGFVGCSLFYHAGLNKDKYGRNPSERCLHGHMICEAILDNGLQFMDIDENTFYLDLENERPVSGDAIVADHYLAKREHAYGPMYKGAAIGERAASLFGRDDGATFRAAAGHRMDFNLRPGERIVYRWDNCGKFPTDGTGKRNRRFWGNSRWVYEPVLTPARMKADAMEVADSHVVYEMRCPYAACGGRLEAAFDGSKQQTIAVSIDGKRWAQVWKGTSKCRVETDKALDYKRKPAKYVYWVKVSDPSSLRSLKIETDLLSSPHSLPRLSLGRNTIDYTDDTKGLHEVTITHKWRESGSVKPPKPPNRPLGPKDGETVAATTFPFRWPVVKDATLYHIQVSRRRDFRLAYRPCFDVVVKGTEHHWPFAGMFNPGEQYYWRVRPRCKVGVWGDWSPVWRFKWQGPRPPVKLTRKIHDGRITISWVPNPRGPKPVRYEVYGSDERGFTPSRAPYQVMGLGKQPRNLLCETTECERLVVDRDADEPAMNRSFYRVVAIDKNGVTSGPSELLELPHPFLFTKPSKTAAAGKPYRYQLRTLQCLGDLQYRYAKPHAKFWEKEGYEFELVEGPAWLRLDKAAGLLTGTPSARQVGKHRVRIVCHRRYPAELKKGDYRASIFLKDAAKFQAKHEQTFVLSVRVDDSEDSVKP